MIDDVKAGKVGVIITKDLSRFGRDSVSVKLNMINGIQANSNSEELEKLGNIDKEAFSITEDADRKKVIK